MRRLDYSPRFRRGRRETVREGAAPRHSLSVSKHKLSLLEVRGHQQLVSPRNPCGAETSYAGGARGVGSDLWREHRARGFDGCLRGRAILHHAERRIDSQGGAAVLLDVVWVCCRIGICGGRGRSCTLTAGDTRVDTANGGRGARPIFSMSSAPRIAEAERLALDPGVGRGASNLKAAMTRLRLDGADGRDALPAGL